MKRDELKELVDVGLVEGVAFRCGHCLRLSPLSSHECFNECEEFETERVFFGGRCGWLITIRRGESNGSTGV
jgi:hypothetical protein